MVECFFFLWADLCEAEEESDASDEAQHVPGVTCDDDGAGVTWRRVVGKTALNDKKYEVNTD